MFKGAVIAAAIAVGRDVKILHQLTQPPDHPINAFHPEGNYLKGLVLFVN
jgi:23S rRNA (cytosine1962-C5)-methyltransferase